MRPRPFGENCCAAQLLYTEYLQPNMLGKVVLRYLEEVDGPIVNALRKLLHETLGDERQLTDSSVATLRAICQEVGCDFHEGLCIPVCCTAISVLWMALHKEKFPLLADTVQQKWALILPSSARVSLVTYTTVIAVRYPELDNTQNGLTCFGNYLLGEQSTHGGFLPVFWNAPSAYMHAATDIGSVVEWIGRQYTLTSDENGCLAVLHNRNKMVTCFGNSEWVTQANGSVLSKSVTSCAGMTAHLVLLAQTRVGFLSGGRSKHMKDLPRTEFVAQLEEAYARATVALTRAQKLCIIMGPLDMRGLLGAATVIGCLKYGAGLRGMNEKNRTVEMHLREASIDDGPDDCSFLDSLRRSLTAARGVYPPVAFAEIYCEDSRPSTKIRRLHLIVVDLDRSRNVGKRVYWQFHKAHLSASFDECFNTLPVPTTDPESSHRCRYVYGYGTDGSDQPSYLLWPRRGPNNHFWLVDPWTGRFFDPSMVDFMSPIGVEHFFDAFALTYKRSIREAAAHALRIPVEDIQPNLVVNPDRAQRYRLTHLRA